MNETSLDKKRVKVLGHRMAYHERGAGHPILFLHGNPTSSYIWRNVLPALEGHGRLIVPDLIGTGDSDKLPNPNADTYTYQTHREYIWKFIEQIGGRDEKILFVVHDWGAPYGFEWANHHRDRVRGIAYMEALVRSLADWSEWNPEAKGPFQAFRSDKGEKLILDENGFVEGVLVRQIIRKLSSAEMTEYRRPFLRREDRWPTLNWPRSVPVAGEPSDVAEVFDTFAPWMAQNDIPKLFVNAEPGGILMGPLRDFCRTWKNQTEVTVPGRHYMMEDSGPLIGNAVADWIVSHSL